MAYKEHVVFTRPDDLNIKIWRYMDFSKFVSILDTESLFFPRSDKLGDPFEGTYSRANRNLRPHIYKDVKNIDFDSVAKTFAEFSAKARMYTQINCWHMNNYESDAMWKLYLKSGEGIAIQSTYSNLVKALEEEKKDIFIGKVIYLDYSKEWMPDGNSFSPFVHKQIFFQHENELRAVVQEFPSNNKGIDWSASHPQDGINIKINVETLIEKVYIAPTSPSWIFDLVSSIIKKYGFNFEVLQSKLSETPVYY
ncbi:MAG: DUF2971 domain-containing protein [Tissierellia bacterium]|nr:DUF2971 domain-containing protein [Tissierellia bacterium]